MRLCDRNSTVMYFLLLCFNSMSKINLVIFNKDLRIADNPALFFASQSPFMPIFIEPNNIGAASKAWLYLAITDLNKKLNGNLKIYSGNCEDILAYIHNSCTINEIFINKSYDRQDELIKDFCHTNNILLNQYNSNYLTDPSEILSNNSSSFKLFAPFFKKISKLELKIDKKI